MTLWTSRPMVWLSWLLFGCCAAHPVAAADSGEPALWPQWRGPQRDAQVERRAWPESLAQDHLQLRWRRELAPSYSGPIVGEHSVFVTETRDQRTEVVRCLDRATGEERWRAEWEGSLTVPFFAASNGSWIRSTPAYDGERLYVAGMRDVLVCLDARTGDRLWIVDFPQVLGSPLPDFGFVSSPLLHGDDLYVQAGGAFVKLNKLSGELVWRSLEDGGGMYGSAFSSPDLAVFQGVPQLLVQTRSKLAGVDPERGTVLWEREITAFRGMNILTPTVIGDSVFVSSYGGRSLLLTPELREGAWDVQESWTNKAQGYMSSPVVIADHIYLHLRNQRFVCLDARTGDSLWTTTPFGKYWSMVANGDRILALDQRGELLLIRANPSQFELIDRRQIAEDSWAHLAVCGEELFVRELEAISAYEWK